MARLFQRKDSAIAVHSFMEVRRGADPKTVNPTRLHFVESLGEFARILPFDKRCALLAGGMAAVLDREGASIPELDLCIAASTLVWGDGVIVTRDTRHFLRLRRFGLRVEPA